MKSNLEMILWHVHRHQGSRSYRHLCREVHDVEEMGGTSGSQLARLEKEPDHQMQFPNVFCALWRYVKPVPLRTYCCEMRLLGMLQLENHSGEKCTNAAIGRSISWFLPVDRRWWLVPNPKISKEMWMINQDPGPSGSWLRWTLHCFL